VTRERSRRRSPQLFAKTRSTVSRGVRCPNSRRPSHSKRDALPSARRRSARPCGTAERQWMRSSVIGKSRRCPLAAGTGRIVAGTKSSTGGGGRLEESYTFTRTFPLFESRPNRTGACGSPRESGAEARTHAFPRFALRAMSRMRATVLETALTLPTVTAPRR